MYIINAEHPFMKLLIENKEKILEIVKDKPKKDYLLSFFKSIYKYVDSENIEKQQLILQWLVDANLIHEKEKDLYTLDYDRRYLVS